MLGGQTIQNSVKPVFQITKTVGLISDTHVPKRARTIPSRVFEIFEKVDYIIHAGDLVDVAVIDELEQIAPVLAVSGNMDGLEVTEAFPKLNSLKVFDWKIGLVHDQSRISEFNGLEEIAAANKFDVLVYGHTHVADVRWVNKILYINPGSPTDPPSYLVKPTVGLLKITRNTILPQIVDL